jgi:hypothetical protein
MPWASNNQRLKAGAVHSGARVFSPKACETAFEPLRRQRLAVYRIKKFGQPIGKEVRGPGCPGQARPTSLVGFARGVSLACRKAKDLGYPHELWTTRLLANHAREHGPAEGHGCLTNLAQGTVCKILDQEEVKPHKVRYYLEQRDPDFAEKMAEVLCVYRQVKILKEDLAHRTLHQVGEALMPLHRSMLASVAGQKPRRPQFVGIAKVLRLPACQRHQPCLGFEGDRRLPTGARAIVQRSYRAFNHGALDAALNGLMMQSERSTNRKKRRVFPIGQQYPCSFDPARRLRSRLRYRFQLCRILVSQRQFNRPPPRCHDLTPSLGTRDLYRSPRIKMNPPVMTTFMESIV